MARGRFHVLTYVVLSRFKCCRKDSFRLFGSLPVAACPFRHEVKQTPEKRARYQRIRHSIHEGASESRGEALAQ